MATRPVSHRPQSPSNREDFASSCPPRDSPRFPRTGRQRVQADKVFVYHFRAPCPDLISNPKSEAPNPKQIQNPKTK
jgi:hypothetical protein